MEGGGEVETAARRTARTRRCEVALEVPPWARQGHGQEWRWQLSGLLAGSVVSSAPPGPQLWQRLGKIRLRFLLTATGEGENLLMGCDQQNPS